MCGILGQFDLKGNCSYSAFESALNRLYHRGPDHGGIKEFPQGMLGHRRLSIIDLSANANQPFQLPDNENLNIVFNGEIYNYKELSKNLSQVKTQSDTEVVLRGYAEKGISFFKSLRGIYAFAIADYRDKDSPRVILYRDPAGIKPLYYSSFSSGLVFASEIKAIIPLVSELTICDDVIKTYLSIGYCPEPYTIYKEIKALEPGHVMEVNLKTLNHHQSSVFNYNFLEKNDLSHSLLEDEVSNLLKQSVDRNVVSDVPVLFSLSGGIDSSLIVALSKKNNFSPETLTVSFDDTGYNEGPEAELFSKSLGITSSFVSCDTTGSLELLKKLLLHFDQPYADSSFIPFYFLTKAAASKARVLIGGDGGDEIHAGYSNFITVPKIRKLKILRPLVSLLSYVATGNKKRLLKKIAFLMATKSDDELIYLRESWLYPELMLNGVKPFLFDYQDGLKIYNSCFPCEGSFMEKFSYDVFYRRMLSDYLRKSDMMSMINSVEYRVPMLDEDLVAFSLGIPLKRKIELKRGKRILRSLHSKFFPPVTSRRSKTGFTIPLDTWLSKADFDSMEDYIINDGIVKRFVNVDYIKQLFKALNNQEFSSSISRAGVYQQILILFSLQLWYKEGRK